MEEILLRQMKKKKYLIMKKKFQMKQQQILLNNFYLLHLLQIQFQIIFKILKVKILKTLIFFICIYLNHLEEKKTILIFF